MWANNFIVPAVNKGGGKLNYWLCPDAAQIAPIFGMVAEGFYPDGNRPGRISGDEYGNEVFNGRYDAMNGLVMLEMERVNLNRCPSSKAGSLCPRCQDWSNFDQG